MYDGGQKCWGLPSDISTTGYLTPPPSTMLNFDQNGWKWVFLGSKHCRAGEWGYEGMNPKPIKTLLLAAESYNYLVFSPSPKFLWPTLSVFWRNVHKEFALLVLGGNSKIPCTTQELQIKARTVSLARMAVKSVLTQTSGSSRLFP